MVAGHATVSFDDEPLVLVDDDDNVVGYGPKADVHQGKGSLHRAFSIFIFNGQGEVLLHQRSAHKPLWPLFWTNSCCSHPRRGETLDDAAHRRLGEELGLQASLRLLYKFIYRAEFHAVSEGLAGDGPLVGSEHELCSVFVGRTDAAVVVNANEIAQWRYMGADAVDRDVIEQSDAYTPWFKLEWPLIRRQHWGDVQGLLHT